MESTQQTDNRQNLIEFNEHKLTEYLLLNRQSSKKFNAIQILKWIHQKRVSDFNDMTNLSKELREFLLKNCYVEFPTVYKELVSIDGTIKWILELHDKLRVEMVYIPERERGTLCISSQVGCSIGCKFCATGKMGFYRNLSIGEIVGQLWIARQKYRITNVVLMGMGEPMLNIENVIRATEIMLDDNMYGISKRRITLSTSGILDQLDRVIEELDIEIAISLHATSNNVRDELVPINIKYNIEQIIDFCKKYNRKDRFYTIEYIMLNHFNDSVEDVRLLTRMFSGINIKVNLIPYNDSNSDLISSSYERINAFKKCLIKKGIFVSIRKSRGADISASCGQLISV